jgi:hypothetical protein
MAKSSTDGMGGAEAPRRGGGGRSRRKLLQAGALAVLLPATAWVWAPVGAGVLVRGAHDAFHRGELGAARARLEAAAWLLPGDCDLRRAIAVVDGARDAGHPGHLHEDEDRPR